MLFIVSLCLAVILDFLLGDPAWLYHPVILIGKTISFLEKNIRKIFPKTNRGEIIGGAVMTVLTMLIVFFIPFGILKIVRNFNIYVGFVLETFWMYQILATKCMKVESVKVYEVLKLQDIEVARKRLSYLVGRDTQTLSEEEVIKATVETVAENTTDGVVAPLIFMLIGGAPLGFLYKAVNTMDSMVGYKNEKYLYFGRVSAYTDDVFNFIPARICALIMIISSVLCRLNFKNAWKVFLRDRKNHLSPNSAQTESVVAGALDIQLGGTHDYFGKPVYKPTIGDSNRKVENNDIVLVNRLMYVTTILSCFIGIGIRGVIMIL